MFAGGAVLTGTLFAINYLDLDKLEAKYRYLYKGTICMSVITMMSAVMLHPIQVVEAAEGGARCILIIVRTLTDDEIKALREAADLAGLDAIYEIHEEQELERALRFDPKIIGVNNRDLKRFTTDLAISEQLIPQIPEGIVKISESGIFDDEDAQRAKDCGADAILVGEALMRSEDVEALVRSFHKL